MIKDLVTAQLAPLKPYIWLIKLGLAAFLGTSLFVSGCVHGKRETQADYDAYRAKVVNATKQAAAKAKRAEELQKIAFDEIGKKHKEDLKDAKAENDRVVAGLRARTIRLQDHFSCPAPGASTSAEVADENTRLREKAAADIVQIGREADDQIKGLQAVLEAERVKND